MYSFLVASFNNLSVLVRPNAKHHQKSQSFVVIVVLREEMEVAEAERRGSGQERMRHVVMWPCKTPIDANASQDS